MPVRRSRCCMAADRKLASGQAPFRLPFAPVSGRLPMGTFRSNRMTGDLAGNRVSLIGNVHLRINQRGGRG